jgi:hypothetical protein
MEQVHVFIFKGRPTVTSMQLSELDLFRHTHDDWVIEAADGIVAVL